RLGKRVLRPGGRELTRWMLSELVIHHGDDVVELAPGIGATARELFKHDLGSYVAIDADRAATRSLSRSLAGPNRTFVDGQAQATGLADESASVELGDAFLTMQTASSKEMIVAESARILRPNGRLGLHELCILSEDALEGERIRRELSETIRVNANPLTPLE